MHCRAPAVLIVSIGLFVSALILPRAAYAWPTKYTSCSSCHAATEPTASVTTAVDGIVTTLASVAPGGSFEIDYKILNIAGAGVLGLEVAVPTGWTVATGTSNSPAIPGWSTTWDATSGVPAGWATGNGYSTASEWPSSPQGYTINFDTTGWDSGNRNAAFDNAGAGDLDGTANAMGSDLIVTVPGGATPGDYQVTVLGIGHNVGGTKGNVSTTITVTVGAAGDSVTLGAGTDPAAAPSV
ncbi:MAG: filamentous hemagglutinin, partial [Deltaproteobacteria bacterium]|nr:filamentous hemagglutinin [Deltaproteobacteria bacterium]